MAGIDKAAIGFSIAITVIGVAMAAAGSQMQESGQNFFASDSGSAASTAPKGDPFADAADKAKMQAAEREQAMKEQLGMTQKEDKQDSVSLSTPKVEAPPTSTGPKTVDVDMPKGTSVPGCEETDACFVPSSVSIKKGDTVNWINSDTAAHTVTGGTPDGGPDGTFDSSLVMAGSSFANKFDKSGSYDYFCMVHPWMQGNVQVK